jgi:two-component system chemotaxis response regulator CheY
MRILIVDDDYVSRAKLKTMLAPYGDCDVAPNGKIGFEMFQIAHKENLPYKLITMDIDMADNDGRAIVKQIREWEEKNDIVSNGEPVEIIMVTVMDQPKDIMKSFTAGCEAYLVKPFTTEKLEHTLKEMGLIE